METPPDADITITVGGSKTISNRLEDLRFIVANHPEKSDLLDGMKEEDHKDYRNLVAAGPSPLLPPQIPSEAPAKWVHVKLEVDGSKEWVMFIMRPDNLYVVGFLNEQDGVTRAYEVNHVREKTIKGPSEGESSKNESVPTQLQASYRATLLRNWRVSYQNLFSCQADRDESTPAEKEELKAKLEQALFDIAMDELFEPYAVTRLSGFSCPLDQDYIKNSDDAEDMEFRRIFGGLIFRLCEPTRMNLKLDGSAKITDQVWSWGAISRSLLFWRDKRYDDAKFNRYSKLGITLPLHAIQFLNIILNRAKKHFDAISGNKSRHGAGGGSGSGSGSGDGEPKDYGDYSRGPEDRKEDREDDPQDDQADFGAAQYEGVGHQLLSISANFEEKGTEKEGEKKGEKTESRKRKRSNYNEEDSVLEELARDDMMNATELAQWENSKSIDDIAASQGIRIRRHHRPASTMEIEELGAPPNILERIIWDKEVEVAEGHANKPLKEVIQAAEQAASTRDFFGALAAAYKRNGLPALIAEVKKASPSRGVLRENFDPVEIAQAYEKNGAACLSILTDEKYFQGSFENLEKVRNSGVKCPLLCKEFVIDKWQIYYARSKGADAILLIAAVLTDLDIKYFLRICKELGMTALIEVHDEREMERVLKINGVQLIGINNRSLETFVVDTSNTKMLLEKHGDSIREKAILVVGESGLFTPNDVAYVQNAGVSAVLVGESLVKQEDPGRAIAGLFGKELVH